MTPMLATSERLRRLRRLVRHCEAICFRAADVDEAFKKLRAAVKAPADWRADIAEIDRGKGYLFWFVLAAAVDDNLNRVVDRQPRAGKVSPSNPD